MKSQSAKPENATVGVDPSVKMRPSAKSGAKNKANEAIEAQQAKLSSLNQHDDELEQEVPSGTQDQIVSYVLADESLLVAQAGVVGQIAAGGGQVAGAGAGAAGIGAGAAAASSGVAVGVATTAVAAAAVLPAFPTLALNLGAGAAVAGLAAAAGGGSDKDKVAPGAPVIASAQDDVAAVTGEVVNSGVTNDLLPLLVINAAPGNVVKVYQMVGSNAVLVSGAVVEGPSGRYTFTPTVAFENAQTYTFKASATDPAGNESGLSSPFNLTLDTTAPAMPTLVVDNITANNDVVVPTESSGNVNVTGATSAPNGSVVTVSVNNKTFTGTVTDGNFTVAVPGSDLAADNDTQLSVSVAVTDAAGNTTTQQVSKDYTSSQVGAAPTVTLNEVTADGILNAEESLNQFTQITGTATGYQAGNTVTLTLNSVTYEGAVDGSGAFSIPIATAALLNSVVKTIQVSLRTDTATASNSVGYTVDTVAPSSYSLSVDDLTSDNTLTNVEALVTQQISGSTSAPDGTTVSVTVHGTTRTAEVDNGRYSIDVPGAELLADEDNRFEVSIVSTDAAGNRAVTEVVHVYALAAPAPTPVIVINPVTGDDILSARDIAPEQLVEISGSVSYANDGDEVVITVNGVEYTGMLAYGSFSINVFGSDLAVDPDFSVKVTTLNELDNAIEEVLVYDQLQIETEVVPPEVSLAVVEVNIDGTIDVQFTFSEQVTKNAIFDENDLVIGYKPFITTEIIESGSIFNRIVVENGVLVNFLQSEEDPLVWTATFEPSASNVRGVIKLPENSFSDLDGNYNASTVIQPLWMANASSLLIDYSATPKTGFYDAAEFTNNEPLEANSYKTDADDVFQYEFGRLSVQDTYYSAIDDLKVAASIGDTNLLVYDAAKFAVGQVMSGAQYVRGTKITQIDEVLDVITLSNPLIGNIAVNATIDVADLVSWPELTIRTWQVGVGDRIKGALFVDVDFAGGETISIPNSFGASMGGDDQIDEGQYEVYYGIYDAGLDIFTVLTTEEFSDSAIVKENVTHTLVMFDNDTQNIRTSGVVDYLRDNLLFFGTAALLEQMNSPSENAIDIGLSADNIALLQQQFISDGGQIADFDKLIGYMRQPFWLDAMVFDGVLDEMGWNVSDSSVNQLLSWNEDTVIAQSALINTSNLEIDYSSADKVGRLDRFSETNVLGTARINTTSNFSYKVDEVDSFFTNESGGFGREVAGNWMNWQIGPGDKIKNAVFEAGFDGTQLIAVPRGLSDSSDDQIDSGDYDFFYGNYLEGVFSILNTQEFQDLPGDKMGSTHTLILYDNDDRGLAYNSAYPLYLGGVVLEGLYLEEDWGIRERDGQEFLKWVDPSFIV